MLQVRTRGRNVVQLRRKGSQILLAEYAYETPEGDSPFDVDGAGQILQSEFRRCLCVCLCMCVSWCVCEREREKETWVIGEDRSIELTHTLIVPASVFLLES